MARTWPAPGSPWVMKQTWSSLLFAHWRVPGDYMRDLVPEQLEIDTFDGSAWIAVVPFLMTGIRFRYLPPIPPTHQTLELNVRTYVRYGGRPGVYFFSLDAERRLIVEAARRFFSLSDPAVSNAKERASSASETCHTSQADIRDIEEMTPRTGSKMSDH